MPPRRPRRRAGASGSSSDSDDSSGDERSLDARRYAAADLRGGLAHR